MSYDRDYHNGDYGAWNPAAAPYVPQSDRAQGPNYSYSVRGPGGPPPGQRGGREQVERRIDPADGNAYTYQEFCSEYGSDREWRRARPASDHGAPRGPAPGGGQERSGAPAAAPVSSEERRIDSDGRAYTVEEFASEYGGSREDPPQQWLRAKPVPRNAVLVSTDGQRYPSSAAGGGDGSSAAAAAGSNAAGHGPRQQNGQPSRWQRSSAPAQSPAQTHAAQPPAQGHPAGGGADYSQAARRGGSAAACSAAAADHGRGGGRAEKRGEVVIAKKREKGVGTELAEDIAQRLEAGTYECMVCMAAVKRSDEAWACRTCYAVFHLQCVTEWAAQTGADGEWRCPACQALQKEPARKLKYKCFCGKEEHPAAGSFETPHSCGQPCGRLREGTQCPHPCTLMCHPGPCPPCLLTSPEKSCFCGRMHYRTRCSDVDPGRSCHQRCGKLLPCGRHRCMNECHSGDCEQCPLKYTQACYCGHQREERDCAAEPGAPEPDELDSDDEDSEEPEPPAAPAYVPATFSCGKPCGKTLSCGNHKCDRPCHTGPCGECPLLPVAVQQCPCGKTPLWQLYLEKRDLQQRESCTDPIPHCSQVCGRALSCGVREHRCALLCHSGPCPDCTQRVTVRCRCTARSATLLCQDAARGEGCAVPLQREEEEAPAEELDIFAGSKKGKGKKKGGGGGGGGDGANMVGTTITLPFLCNTKCGVKKSCGKHTCNMLCCPVRGQPAPPPGFDDCHPHRCTEPCGRKLPCKQHRCDLLCHRGQCPPCPHGIFEEITCRCGNTIIEPPIPCGTQPPQCPFPCSLQRTCGHETSHKCHFGDCPPCIQPVRKKCSSHGNWCDWLTPCHVQEVSCSQPCGKLLACGKHACRKPCHSGECSKECTHPCGKKLPCGHPCPRKCHAGPCDIAHCQQTARVRCGCGRTTEILTCADNYRRTEEQRRQLATALMKEAAEDDSEPMKELPQDAQIPAAVLRQIPDRYVLPCGRRCMR
eukprot:TRINITY_DN15711_c0_g1_i1.p1 TRINITY_DN15711_c0_g1~~TRINITY_DN15711_c0_g1_i1.p1  ORF type:complete len:984 (+),score=205.85 TRINITY_DN15711_c0_g1_i1:498-3449(+)